MYLEYQICINYCKISIKSTNSNWRETGKILDLKTMSTYNMNTGVLYKIEVISWKSNHVINWMLVHHKYEIWKFLYVFFIEIDRTLNPLQSFIYVLFNKLQMDFTYLFSAQMMYVWRDEFSQKMCLLIGNEFIIRTVGISTLQDIKIIKSLFLMDWFKFIISVFEVVLIYFQIKI